MLRLLNVAVFVCLYYLSQAGPDKYGRKGYCDDDADCKKTKCCVEISLLRGKRDLEPDLTYVAKGKCENLGILNGTCIIPNLSPELPGIRHFNHCPCSRGLFCEGTGLSEVPLGEIGVCKPKEIPCNKKKDCPKKHCCVSNALLKGKRSVDSATAMGKCQPLGKLGSSCLPENKRVKGLWLESCPCRRKLRCEPDGGITIPLGQTGKCGRRGYVPG